MVACTIVLFSITTALNEWLFRSFEFVRGINWIYLPAGVRLLCTLLFAEAGALGLLIITPLASFLWYFPHDPMRAFAGAVFPVLAPYLVYLYAERRYGFRHSLANLTPARLLKLIVLYAIGSPLLHHLWFLVRGEHPDALLHGFIAMVTGDLLGSLVIVYFAKLMISIADRSRTPHDPRTGHPDNRLSTETPTERRHIA